MKNFKEFINEDNSQDKIDVLAKKFLSSMETVDSELTITNFSKIVAKIVIEEYGSHNYNKFIATIKSEFDKQDEEDKKEGVK